MIILACDYCHRQSPDKNGNRIAEDWITVTLQRQRWRDRDKDHSYSTRLILCEECFPLLGTEIKVSPP